MCLFVAASAFADPLPDKPHIYVEGHHTSVGEADRFSVDVMISEVAENSSLAAQVVAEKLSSILETAKELGIPSEQIRALEISVAPEREWRDGEYIHIGTRVSRELEFKHDQIGAMQKLLEALVRSNIAEITGARAYSSKEEQLHNEAIEGAVVNAKERAGRLAQLLDARLGKVHSISEFLEHHRPMQLRELPGYAADVSALGSESVVGPFTPGPVEISARVYVVFLLR